MQDWRVSAHSVSQPSKGSLQGVIAWPMPTPMSLRTPAPAGSRKPVSVPLLGTQAVSYTHLDVYKRQM